MELPSPSLPARPSSRQAEPSRTARGLAPGFLLAGVARRIGFIGVMKLGRIGENNATGEFSLILKSISADSHTGAPRDAGLGTFSRYAYRQFAAET